MTSPISLCHPVLSAEDDIRAFHLSPATSTPVRAGGFVGKVAEGGSCNCETVTFCPHSSGTHTENIGHLLEDPLVHVGLVQPPLIAPCVLVTVSPRLCEADALEGYVAAKRGDLVVTGEQVQEAVAALLGPNLDDFRASLGETGCAVVLRTDPSAQGSKHFSGTNPPYPLPSALGYLSKSLDCRHFLTSLPSIDREDDGGRMASHIQFFGASKDTWASLDPQEKSRIVRRSVTELAKIPSLQSLNDGIYKISLQIAPFHLDAAPSNPILILS
jgi:arylformamidase